MMLTLTNGDPDKSLRGKPILIAAKHVVAIRPLNDDTAILTVTGVEYRVQESIDEIGKMSAWLA